MVNYDMSSQDFFADALLHESIRESGTPYKKLTGVYNVDSALNSDLSNNSSF